MEVRSFTNCDGEGCQNIRRIRKLEIVIKIRKQVGNENIVEFLCNVLELLEADDISLFWGITFSDIAIAQV